MSSAPSLVLGTMNFGKRTSASEANRIIAAALDAGITEFDTANAYVGGESEKILGRAVRSRRGDVRIATKVGFGRVAGHAEGLSPKRIAIALDESLARLQTDYVDLYYLHVPDHAVPLKESLSALAQLLDQKKIRSWGFSNYAAWQGVEMLQLCPSLGLPPPIVGQQLYNLLIRQLDVEYFRFAKAYGIKTMAYNALAGGLLSGRRHALDEIPKGSRFDGNKLYTDRFWSKTFLSLSETYRAIAETAGLSLLELAYGWLASCGSIDAILLGPASVEHLDDALRGCGKRLSEETLAAVNVAHRTHLGTSTTYVR